MIRTRTTAMVITFVAAASASDFTAAAGGMQAIVVDLAKGTMLAGADPRRTGYAVGW